MQNLWMNAKELKQHNVTQMHKKARQARSDAAKRRVPVSIPVDPEPPKVIGVSNGTGDLKNL